MERRIVTQWLDALNQAIKENDYGRAADLFGPVSYWRDVLALTWDIRTYAGPQQIKELLTRRASSRRLGKFVLEDSEPTAGKRTDADEPTLEAFLRFESIDGPGRGHVRLAQDPESPGMYRGWTFLTTLQALRRFPQRPRDTTVRDNCPEGAGFANWRDQRVAESSFLDRDPDVLIVGAGHAGLGLAARLRQHNISTLVIDKEEQIGDNWRRRYHSLRLHNETVGNHMPYLPFPATWPVYAPKDMLADWMQFYAAAMELNVWTSSEFLHGEYNSESGRWNAQVACLNASSKTLHPRHIVLSVGLVGAAKMPRIPGINDFRGILLHSTEDMNGLEPAGKSILVVGAGSSAHDIAQEMYLRGAQVTLLQRSATTVISLHPSAARLTARYTEGEGRRPLEDSDVMRLATPNLLLSVTGPTLAKQMSADDKKLHDSLSAVGFLHDRAMGPDGAGIAMMAAKQEGTFYFDVGASQLIADGRIKLKAGVGIDRFGPTSVVFSDESTMEPDIVILATGYEHMNGAVRRLFGDKVADAVGPIWKLGDDGELRNMWRRTAQPGLFVHAGGFGYCRIYSHFVALQIKAVMEGLIPDGMSDSLIEADGTTGLAASNGMEP
jgi:cation diffusion facilitator CzcD-associated flavoprotein CzcO